MEDENLVKVFSGAKLTAMHLKGILEQNGIKVTMRNEFQAGVEAGLGLGSSNYLDVYIMESDLEKAQEFVEKFPPKEE